MTDAPERIWADPDVNDHTNPASDDWDSGYWSSLKYKGPHSIEYVRVVPAEDDAGDDARIAAASRQEWAERAWRAEAERDRLREALNAVCEVTTDVWASEIARAALKGET